jgi:hypothetical protein
MYALQCLLFGSFLICFPVWYMFSDISGLLIDDGSTMPRMSQLEYSFRRIRQMEAIVLGRYIGYEENRGDEILKFKNP